VPEPEVRRRYTREHFTYMRVLAGTPLDPPQLLGSMCDPVGSRYSLALEHLHGEPIRLCNSHHFELVATWLGRMDAHFQRHPERLTSPSPLIVQDGAFFRARAELVRIAAKQYGVRVRYRIDRALEVHDAVSNEMGGLRTSLVHGALLRRHVLICTGSGQARVRLLDWTHAGLGSPLYDLARIAEACTPATRERMVHAYRDELVRGTSTHVDGWHTRRMLNCFRLHHALDSLAALGRGPHHQAAASRVSNVTDRLARLVSQEQLDE